jgi:hypothetical protein
MLILSTKLNSHYVILPCFLSQCHEANNLSNGAILSIRVLKRGHMEKSHRLHMISKEPEKHEAIVVRHKDLGKTYYCITFYDEQCRSWHIFKIMWTI